MTGRDNNNYGSATRVPHVVVLLFAFSFAACTARSKAEPQRPGDPLREANAGDLFNRGKAHLAAGDLIRAEQYFTGAAKRGHPMSEVLPPLLDACIRGGRFQAALGHATTALNKNPGDWRLRYMVATLHHSLGDHANSERELRRVIQDNREYADAHYTLGRVLADGGQTQESLAAFARYLELAPDGPHAVDANARLRAVQRSGGDSSPTAVQPPASANKRPTRVNHE